MENNKELGKITFKVIIDSDFVDKEIARDKETLNIEVIKTFKINWYRRLLLKLGFKVRVFEAKVVLK